MWQYFVSVILHISDGLDQLGVISLYNNLNTTSRVVQISNIKQNKTKQNRKTKTKRRTKTKDPNSIQHGTMQQTINTI